MITNKFKVSWRHFNNVGKLQAGEVVLFEDSAVAQVIQVLPKNQYVVAFIGRPMTETQTVSINEVRPFVPYNKKKKRLRSETHCVIETLEGAEVSRGIAILNPKDKNYHRRIGMKTSFDDALTTLSNKEDREELWEAFKGLSPKCINC